jgi:hypothetical protein
LLGSAVRAAAAAALKFDWWQRAVRDRGPRLICGL